MILMTLNSCFLRVELFCFSSDIRTRHAHRPVYAMDDTWIFTGACLAIIPLAIIIGDATEQIAAYTRIQDRRAHQRHDGQYP